MASVNYNGQRYAYLYNMQGDVVGIVDSAGTEVVKYTYDAWGRLLSKTGTMASTFGTLNPFRYRGYVYDEETGLYYLRSRYYNPTWGRFLNADTVLGIAASLKNRNTYAYCDNNAINQSDASGHVSLSITSPLGNRQMSLREESAGGGGGAWFAILAKRIGRRTARLSATFAPFVALISSVFDITPAAENTQVNADTAEKSNYEPQYIYRIGSGSYTNLTPRTVDVDGLSFTTVRPVGRKCVTTTLEAINATGILCAIKDGPTHVSVRPVDINEMEAWIESREHASTDPHQYTILLKNLLIP